LKKERVRGIDKKRKKDKKRGPVRRGFFAISKRNRDVASKGDSTRAAREGKGDRKRATLHRKDAVGSAGWGGGCAEHWEQLGKKVRGGDTSLRGGKSVPPPEDARKRGTQQT